MSTIPLIRATSPNRPVAGQRGRWVRRGSTIILLPPGAPVSRGGEEGEVPTGASFTKSVIDPRIDVDAQRALISMSNSGDPAQMTAASEIVRLVKTQGLLGIYKPDQREPALLARRRGMSWWELLQPGEDAMLWCDPARKQLGPMLVFRKDISREQLIFILMGVASIKDQLTDPNVCA
jgi:hypothetical protein